MSRIDRAFARYCETRDPHALARVFDAVAPDLLRLARHLAPQAAEDVLQDTFLEIWKSATQYDPERASADRWVATILRTRAIDRLRKRNSRWQADWLTNRLCF